MNSLMDIMENVMDNMVHTTNRNKCFMYNVEAICKSIQNTNTNTFYFVWGCYDTGTQLFMLNGLPHYRITERTMLEELQSNAGILGLYMSFSRINIFFEIEKNRCDMESLIDIYTQVKYELKKDVISDDFCDLITKEFSELEIKIIHSKKIDDKEFSEYDGNMELFVKKYSNNIINIINGIDDIDMQYYNMVYSFAIKGSYKALIEYKVLNEYYLNKINYSNNIFIESLETIQNK